MKPDEYENAGMASGSSRLEYEKDLAERLREQQRGAQLATRRKQQENPKEDQQKLRQQVGQAGRQAAKTVAKKAAKKVVKQGAKLLIRYVVIALVGLLATPLGWIILGSLFIILIMVVIFIQ